MNFLEALLRTSPLAKQAAGGLFNYQPSAPVPQFNPMSLDVRMPPIKPLPAPPSPDTAGLAAAMPQQPMRMPAPKPPAMKAPSVSMPKAAPAKGMTGFSSGRAKAAEASVGDPGALATLLADYPGRAMTAANITPWLAFGADAFRSPSGNADEHEDVLNELASVRGDALSNTELRLGGSNLWQDMFWKKQRDGEKLPWTSQIGGRVLQNPRTGPLGKLLGWPTQPLRWGITSLLRAPHYDPFTDTAHNMTKNPVVTEHELGHAIDYNSLVNKGKIPKSLLGRLGAGTLRDLYSVAYALPFVNLYHEAEANRHSSEALRDALTNKQEYLKRMRERIKTLPAAYGSYLGGATGSLLSSVDPMARVVGPIIGTFGGKMYGKDPNVVDILMKEKERDWEAHHNRKPTSTDERPKAKE